MSSLGRTQDLLNVKKIKIGLSNLEITKDLFNATKKTLDMIRGLLNVQKITIGSINQEKFKDQIQQVLTTRTDYKISSVLFQKPVL